jgi:hypothetical protein
VPSLGDLGSESAGGMCGPSLIPRTIQPNYPAISGCSLGSVLDPVFGNRLGDDLWKHWSPARAES